jgi:glycosyltransferase involved in cell wall biosynthesis
MDFCSILAAAGHDVTLVTTSDVTDVPERWRDHRPGYPNLLKVDPPTLPGGFFTRAAMRATSQHLREKEVLHLHGMWCASNIQFATAARRSNLPYVHTVHGMLDDWCMGQQPLRKRFFWAAFDRRVLQDAAAVHCTAQAELEQAKKWFSRGRGVVIPYVFDLGPFAELPGPGLARTRFALSENRPTALLLSRLHQKKGIELLIRATSRAVRDGADWLVLVAGTGDPAYEARLEKLTDELQLRDHVRFLRFVSGAEKVSLYQAADVFVLPTSQENFGFVLFEALAAGTPVVTTRGTDAWPELEASGGAVFATLDAESIVDAVNGILRDPGRRRDMGRAGRKWVFENLRGESIVKRFERLYARAASADYPLGEENTAQDLP